MISSDILVVVLTRSLVSARHSSVSSTPAELQQVVTSVTARWVLIPGAAIFGGHFVQPRISKGVDYGCDEELMMYDSSKEQSRRERRWTGLAAMKDDETFTEPVT
ncbi:hypothetical protein QAD02_000762 [Eretmocerus hayati]|uniref:Uncharacterized protein n=1 Tax=Eretmocerus hayati TaxID=131215 RepID=A0ACC2NEC2_9HYME|nr:hypothetical protein QAD02_000762 [Eretmocerus hayati]